MKDAHRIHAGPAEVDDMDLMPGPDWSFEEESEVMRIRRAVILAIARDCRSHASGPLLVAGRPLLDHQVDVLERRGIRDIIVVVGPRQRRACEHLERRVTIVENRRAAETGTAFDLWLAANHVADGAFVIDGALVFTPALLDRALWRAAPDVLLVDGPHRFAPGAAKVRLAGPFVIDISTTMAPERAAGGHIGLLKVSEAGGARLAELLDRLVATGQTRASAHVAVGQLAHRWPLMAIDVDDLAWTRVDRRIDDFVPAPTEAGRVPSSVA